MGVSRPSAKKSVSKRSTLQLPKVQSFTESTWCTPIKNVLESPQRITKTLVTSVMLPILTVLMCYLFWLSEGCAPFLPFISDLGMEASGIRTVFNAGLTFSALPLAVTQADLFMVRQTILHGLAKGGSFLFASLWNVAMVVIGLCLAIGIGALGFFPWDSKLDMHLKIARIILGAGFIWTCSNLVFSTYVRFALERAKGWTRLRTFQICVALVNICSLFLLVTFVKHGIRDSELKEMLQNAPTEDFVHYCGVEYARTHSEDLNLGALFEWMWAVSLLMSIGTSQMDIHVYSCIKADVVDDNVVLSP